MKKWNGKNALRILLYLVLYMAGTAITCFTGAIHPIVFVCYQITAGILLSGIVIKGFDQVKAPGVSAVFAAGIILIFVAIGDASVWHCIPLVVIAVMAEILITALVGGIAGYFMGFGFAQLIGRSVFDSAIEMKVMVIPIVAALIALVTMAGSFPAIRTVLRLRPAEVLHGGH